MVGRKRDGILTSRPQGDAVFDILGRQSALTFLERRPVYDRDAGAFECQNWEATDLSDLRQRRTRLWVRTRLQLRSISRNASMILTPAHFGAMRLSVTG